MAWWDDLVNTITGVTNAASSAVKKATPDDPRNRHQQQSRQERITQSNDVYNDRAAQRSSQAAAISPRQTTASAPKPASQPKPSGPSAADKAAAQRQAAADYAARKAAQSAATMANRRQSASDYAARKAEQSKQTMANRQASASDYAARKKAQSELTMQHRAESAAAFKAAHAPKEDTKKIAAVKPETITIPDAAADSDYQRARADLQRQLSGYQNQQNLALNQYKGGYDDSLNQMGWRGKKFDPNDKTGSYGQSYYDNENDFAGRGLADSGLRVQALSSLNDTYNQKKTGLDRGYQDYQDTQKQALSNYTADNTASQQNALAEAVARIAAKYGVGTTQVPQGTGAKTMAKPTSSI